MDDELKRGDLTPEQMELADRLVAAFSRERAAGRIEVEFGSDLATRRVWRHQVFTRRDDAPE